ncbi:tRNA (adenosine(37)-N6)-threonylcarbamoyltransferase complex dimerization subunit type 1 TsaB [Leptospira langatensis]|uniref:tRNA (Adenosine(37)-N6)-threonylcarbamoyltransferase complex dimerization subunit type 1 TsaB n=1 Tax=Leptospira langatensis TaxID=2484983 RepID=A0A5F1ZW55_9LEPT|nr:tRNA (adenosine(37)-N6)-threonylcarbamoyltransferase complex dimerization subunit type 1 TsaB [Leptospira langatensis]TGK03124.1 tRNA (adenosine(37)-N6)-threonylcarbamoyltransferase complex dimerization subunit type 1 TsaB [Leptospira langatensis]TGL41881.1 tRNA (adenosine(37)-N6)-threonylcarbamoyltransferase complex dimerization subunit type 1 TsaB [Leptospira langatensis]
MNKILFFDATNTWILVGCYSREEDGKLNVLSKYEELHNRESSTVLIAEIRNCLQKANWEKPDLIVTALGPGSFTGIRISVATARNLSQIWNIPAIGFDSLEIYTAHYFTENETAVSVSIEAKQSKIYFGLRDSRGYCGTLDIPPDLIPEKIPEDRLGSYITGLKFTDSPDLYPGQGMKENLPSPMASLLEKANELTKALSNPADYSYDRLVPHYLRGTYADDKPKVYYT